MRIQGYTLKGKFVPFDTPTPKPRVNLYMITTTEEIHIGEFDTHDKAEKFSEEYQYQNCSWRIESI